MIPMTPLCELAVRYGSDKAPQLRAYPVTPEMALPSHAYTPYYHELFKGFRVERMLEIGIYEGASLRMWRDYFPEADIYGLDNQVEFLINDGKIKSLYCDAGDPDSIQKTMARIGAGLNLIIDDGSHKPADQITAANALVPYLAPGGIYVIEDVGHPDIVIPELEYSCELKEFHVNEMKHDDDRLVVIRR